MSNRIKTVVLLGLILLSACVPTWQLTQEKPPSLKMFEVELPESWLYLKDNSGKSIIASTDGPLIQRIFVGYETFDKAFAKTEREVTGDTLISEVMDYYIAEVKASNAELVFESEEKSLVEVSENEGFRVIMAYKNAKGLRFKKEIIGTRNQDGMFFLAYDAPVILYYEKSKPVFDDVVQSFKIL